MLKLLTDNRDWAIRKRAFRIWQQTPHRLSPLGEVTHTCKSCGTEFQGNYCPRCGQSAAVGRFSFKTAFLLFLDIWGMGNRGMFRSIRDLMLRPGYMIRDYVSGRQSAYFPPFKMFFILMTISLLISHGINLNLEEQQQQAKVEQSDSTTININKEIVENEPKGITVNGNPLENKAINYILGIPKGFKAIEKKYPSLFAFVMLVLFSGPLYLFFRRCPAIPDLRYSEHLVALVYTSNTYSLYQIFSSLTPGLISDILKLMAVIMIFISLKQFTGYSKRRLLGYITLASLLFLIVFIAVCAIAIGIMLL